MTRRALPISAHTARHVIGCHLTQETRVHRALDDVAITIHQSCHLNQEIRVHKALDDVASTIHKSLAMDSARQVIGCHFNQ